MVTMLLSTVAVGLAMPDRLEKTMVSVGLPMLFCLL